LKVPAALVGTKPVCVRILEMLGPQRWRREGDRWVYKGETIFEAVGEDEISLGYIPGDIEYAYPNRGEDEVSSPISDQLKFIKIPHPTWMFYLARICNHCTYPACLAACPRRAIYKRRGDGVVLVDQVRCRGYRECLRSCPYKKVFYNHVTRIAEKCIFCYPALEAGTIPRCFRNCIGKIRIFGYISLPENADPENPIDFLVHVKKVAVPLLPQLGLEPNIYYIPPIHVASKRYIAMLFGPQGVEAVENYVKAIREGDLETLGALILANSTDRIYARFRVVGEEVAGYDERGREVVRVPIKEKVIIRPSYDPRIKVYLRNDM
jgi:nitrate reductase beta subunit